MIKKIIKSIKNIFHSIGYVLFVEAKHRYDFLDGEKTDKEI